MTSRRSEALQRIEELAEASGATVRNIRVYQERGLLQPPIREGRAALYGPEHRTRLALILRLLNRGYTFATIEELLIAERHGLTLAELLEADSVRADRRPTGSRRRLTRMEAEAIAGVELPEDLVAMSASVGLVSEPGSAENFFADAYMYNLFRQLMALGIDEDGIAEMGRLFLAGQSTAAETVVVVVETILKAGIDQPTVEKLMRSMVPRAGAAARLIFLSAAETILTERYGFSRE